MDKLRRYADDRLGTTAPLPAGTPGKSTLSERLVRRAADRSGSALPGDVRERFESSLGTDLSGVRVHTGAESAAAAESVGAKAYAVGQDIHFGAGHYDPSSRDGLFLIAHEVAHTVQQSGATPSRQNKLEVSEPGDTAEVDADRAAAAMVDGAPALIGSAGTGIARSPGDTKEKTDKPKPWWQGGTFAIKPPALGKEEGSTLTVGVSDAGVLSGSAGIGGKEEATFNHSMQWPVGAGMANVGASASVGVAANALAKVTGSFVQHEEDHDKDHVNATVTISGGGEFFAEGKILAGGGVGIPNAINTTLNGYAALGAKLPITLSGGGVVKISKGGDLSGSISLDVTVSAAIEATGGFCVIAKFFAKETELYDLQLAQWTIADVSISGGPVVTFPGATVSGDVKVGEPAFHMPPGFALERVGDMAEHKVKLEQWKAKRAYYALKEQEAKDTERRNAEETCTPQYPEGKPIEPYGPPAPEDAKVPYADDFRPEDEGPIKPE
jgi:hypothetical protein